FEAKYGGGYPIAGEYTGLLNNGGEEIVLRDAAGVEIHDFDYKDGWYDITDGGGFSLAVADESSADVNDWDLKEGWRPSSQIYGTPGDEEDLSIPALGSIVVNEVLAHSHITLPDWVEFYNTTAAPIDISGWFLSDSENSDPNMKKYEIAAGTVINPYDYIVFNQQDHFGDTNNIGCNIAFGLSEGGETVYLRSGDGGVITGYIEQEDFGASETNVAFGRYEKSTGTFNFVAMSYNTPDSANAYPKVGPIVINEIMYNPASDISEEEYVELHNITSSPVTLQTYDNIYSIYVPWLLEKGIDYTFPLGTTIPANGYLIVANDPAIFTSTYGSMPAGVSVLGPYDGKLNNGGEKLDLMMAGDKEPTDDRYYIRVDRLNYSDGDHPENFDGMTDPWPTSPDGDGDSLSRIYEDAYGNDPNNWQGQAETPGSAN
ncbi:MAG: lamin tail domain-containing protein, partial [Planctomycetes bacterium]|nr:lamin tail domain-containing protein [Planctomycetota bacterium]